MSQLSLFFIGPPQVDLDGVTVEMDRRKVLALLVYLAVTEQRHSRDELAELLYTDQTATRARANLRQTLSFLRTAIGRERLDTNRLAVWLHGGEDLWVDVAECQRLMRNAQKADAQDDQSAAHRQFSEAVELYRGEFLSGFYLRDGFAFEEWQLMMCENLRRQQITGLSALIGIESQWRMYDQAIEHVRRLLAVDPLQEAAHRQLMELLSATGRRAEALRQYENCRVVLEREIGETPDAETGRLRERIASGRPLPRLGSSRPSQGEESSLSTRRSPPANNLRIQPTPFMGRQEELRSVTAALLQPEVRLLTLTGTAGTGKTRLALQAAAATHDRFEQGVFFVDLAALSEPEHLVGAVVGVLGVRESGGDDRSLLEVLKDYLGSKRILLLLDNFEHLLPAAPRVAELLESCPRLKILATSREALHLRAERIYTVPPMRLPLQGQSCEEMLRAEAIRLFSERAAAVQPAFQLSEKNLRIVAEICNRLDGLPLAIELAATRLKTLTLQTLLTKLSNRLDVLNRGSRDLPVRQQTLKGEIDWSYELLGPGERRLFLRLSVFPAGFTLETAESVCSLASVRLDVFSCLSSLIEKNLVLLVGSQGESRYRMLETIREYARDGLERSGERKQAESELIRYFAGLVEQAETNLYGPDQMEWLRRIDTEYGNILRVLALLHERQEVGRGLRFSGSLGWYWFRRARLSDGQHWLGLFRNAVDRTAPLLERARAAYFLGWMSLYSGSVWGNPAGASYFRESYAFWNEAGHQRGVALSQAWLAWKAGDIEDDKDLATADECVATARKTGDPWTIAFCLKMAFSNLRRQDKNLEQKQTAMVEAIGLARKTGDPFLLSQALTGMGDVLNRAGELESALAWYLDSLEVARGIEDIWSIFYNNFCVAEGYLRLGRVLEARELLTEGLRLAMDSGARGNVGWFIGGFCGLARLQGESERAIRLGAFSESVLNPESRYDPRFAEEFGLDPKVAEEEWRIGRNMSPQEAVAFALAQDCGSG